MAFDNTPPSNSMIFKYAMLAVVALVLLKPLFDLYFDHMFRARQQALVDANPPSELIAQHKWEDKALTGGALPIDRAINALSRDQRTGTSVIAPQPSTDFSAVTGWSKLPEFVQSANPNFVPTPPPAPPPPVAEDALSGGSVFGVGHLDAHPAPAAAAAHAAPAPLQRAPAATHSNGAHLR